MIWSIMNFFSNILAVCAETLEKIIEFPELYYMDLDILRDIGECYCFCCLWLLIIS